MGFRRIRALNDDLRHGKAGPNDRLVVTVGVVENGKDFTAEVPERLASFSAFSPDNDPNGEHDFGIIEVDGQTIYFEIDSYTPDLQGGSEDPADPVCTTRVLTILLASEY